MIHMYTWQRKTFTRKRMAKGVGGVEVKRKIDSHVAWDWDK